MKTLLSNFSRTKRSFVKYPFLASAIILFLISGASTPIYAQQGQESSVPAVVLIDQPYGSHEKQKFDIYLPAGRSAESTPVLFLIHGGGFAAGSKSDFSGAIKWFQTSFPQTAYVSVGYRLADGKAKTNQFPAQEEDVKACIEYVLNNRAEYGISEKFVTYGISAGAHLAMLYAYKYGPISYKPVAVVNVVGSTNMSKIAEQVKMIENHPKKEEFLQVFVDAVGGTLEEKPELYYTSSAINYVTPDSPPTLILHGTDDLIVPRQQSEELAAKLTEHGVKHTYRLYAGQEHTLKGVRPEVDSETITFLSAYLK